jgi:hypothetical protein
MAEHAICGTNGKVLVSTHEVAEVGTWNLTITGNTVEYPKYDAANPVPHRLNCGYDWNGSIGDASWYMDDTAGQKALEDACKGGTTIAIKLYVDASDYYYGNCKISNVNITHSARDRVTVSFDFVATGALTLTLGA